MSSTPELTKVQAELQEHKDELKKVKGCIESLEGGEGAAATPHNSKKLQQLQEEKLTLLALMKELQVKENRLSSQAEPSSSAGAAGAGPGPAGWQVALGQEAITQIATATANALAAQTLQHNQDSAREVVDEIRSWNSTRTVEASKVTVADVFVLRRLLRINLLPYDATNAADVLHPSACDGDFEWDNTPEPSQREAYIAEIKGNISANLVNKLIWKPQTKADLKVKGLGHRVVAKSDELLVAKRWEFVPDAGCVIGIELKKDLTQASRRQGEAEFIAFSLTSNFPFLQLVTDMKRGGLAYYKLRDELGQQVMVEQVLVGMGAFYEFLTEALSVLPPTLTNAHATFNVIEQLQHPTRTKLMDPHIMLRGAASSYSSDGSPDCGDDALHELHSWFPNKQHLEAIGHLPDALQFQEVKVP